MKAIILAAGEGKRVKQLTKNNPKCMIKLFGKTILEHQIEIFKKNNITDITVVTGYKSESIIIPNIKYYKNEYFDSTNMVETLFCAKKELGGDVIISYGDIIFEDKTLKKLIESKNDISIIIDKKWEEYWRIRFENPLDDAETLVLDSNNQIQNIGQKPISIDEIQGQYIGLMMFRSNAIENIKKFYESSKKIFENSKVNPLNNKLKFQQSYMTDFLQGMINEGYNLKAILIENGWLELDTFRDFQIYSEMYKKNTLNKFMKMEK